MQWVVNLLLHRGNDLSTYFLPHAYFFKRAILEFHQIPLWNSIQFAGYPYVADPQSLIFYLPNYLLVLLTVEVAFLILFSGHLVLMAWGAFLLARKVFKLQKLPAVFVALTFTITPSLFAHLEAGHYTMIIAFSWLPWFLSAAITFARSPSVKRAIIAAVLLWLMYLNYINIAYFAFLFFATYSLFHFIFHREKRKVKKIIISYSLFLISFVGLISPVLLPQLEIAPLSTRHLLSFNDIAQPLWSFRLFFQNLFFPYNLNHQQLSTERVLFPGIIVWILAALGWFRARQPDKWFFAGWIAFSLLFALGARIPFFMFFYKYFPGIAWMRVTTRLWIISNLLVAVFAGIGLQVLLKQRKIRTYIWILAIIGLGELLVLNNQIFSRPVQPDQLPEYFYEIIQRDPGKNFRVYCTTGCFSLRRLGELSINSLAGNNPVQLKTSTQAIADAAGYTYSGYIPILPPYPVFDSQPQPNSMKMANLTTKYIASPYQLNDLGFKLVDQQGEFFLYLNQHQLSPQGFPYTPKSLKIGLSLFGLTWVAIIYAYRHPQLLQWLDRARR